jgi:cytochrome c-type biogenesis protein CcmH
VRPITPVSFIAVCLLALCVRFCLAEEAPLVAANPVLEKRVMRLSEGLRCLVCQNQSLSDSNADLAIDLRNQVREMMQAGKTDAQIREYMVASYGDFILYDPPLKATTVVLWIGPFVLLLIGGAMLARYLKQRRRVVTDQTMSFDERERARALLTGIQDGDK